MKFGSLELVPGLQDQDGREGPFMTLLRAGEYQKCRDWLATNQDAMHESGGELGREMVQLMTYQIELQEEISSLQARLDELAPSHFMVKREVSAIRRKLASLLQK